MRISARNVLRGTVVGVELGATTAHVRLDVGGTIVTDTLALRLCGRSLPAADRRVLVAFA